MSDHATRGDVLTHAVPGRGATGGAPLGRVLPLVLLVLLGSAASAALLAAGAPAGLVFVPLSVAVLLALLIAPFPLVDYALALGLLGTLPLVPPSELPNFPLAAAVIVVALVRIVADDRSLPPARSLLLVLGVWALLGIGVAISHWPPASIWLRPAAVLGFGFLAALLGVAVWSNPARRRRWVVGTVAGLLVVSASGLLVFAFQYVVPVDDIVASVVASLGYLRGDAAAIKFDAVNNWVIGGARPVLRALSPLFPAPNGLGGYIGVAAPLAAALALNADAGRRVRLMALTGLGLAVTTLVVTYSRSSWVAAVAAAVAALMIALVARRRTTGTRAGESSGTASPSRAAVRRVAAVTVMAGAIGLAGFLTTSNETAWDRIFSVSDDPSVTERIEGDAEAVDRLEADLWRGNGLGNWTASTDDGATPVTHTAYIHNLYLEYAVATGIFGGVWVVLLLAVTIGGGAVAAVRRFSPEATMLGLALIAIGTYAAVQGLFDDNLLNPQLAWLLFWAFGGAVGVAWSPTARARA